MKPFCTRFFVIFLCLIISPVLADVHEKKLTIFKNLDIGPCMDVAIEGNHAYIIGSNKLYVAEITEPDSPEVKGVISGLGKVRQITVKDGTAYVTSREDGAFIVDVRNPAAPVLLCHYNSVEVATGIGISGKVMFIANRGHGVELVDVSDPKNPEFISLVRTGEAQSVDIRDGYLYTGVHGAKYLVTTDVRDPRKPVITSRVELDGQGDGIYVQGDKLFISTGNRSRVMPNREKNDPGYGTGHGLEIYELTDPAKPRFVSRVKFDKLYTYPDLWNVEVSGDYAFCSDTVNGMYIVDVKNIEKPKISGHFPVSDLGKNKQDNYSGGLAVVDDYIYVAGGKSDLHIIEAKGIAKAQERLHDNSVELGPLKNEVPKGYRLLKPPGQIWAVDVIDDIGIAACGAGGWCSFSLGPNSKVIETYKTDGFALGIGSYGKYVYVPTGMGMVEIWERSNEGGFTKIHTYEASKRMAIKKFVVLKEKKYVLMQVGMSRLEFVDISNPAKPVKSLVHNSTGYINEIIGNNLLGNRYAYANWHVKGLDWFDMGKNPPSFTGKTLKSRGIRGVCAIGEQLIAFTYRGYKIVNYNDEVIETIKDIKLEDPSVAGSPVLHGEYVITANRPAGKVGIIDMSKTDEGKILQTISTDGNPGPVKVYQDNLIIPDGYGGIRIYDDFFKKIREKSG